MPRPSRSSRSPAGSTAGSTSSASYRGAVGRFLTEALDGPLSPDAAEAAARAVPAARLPQREHPFSAIEAEPGGVRTLVRAIRMAGAGEDDPGAADAFDAADGADPAPLDPMAAESA